MTHTLTRIGFLSTVRIAAIVSALSAALPVAALLLQVALLGAFAGGMSTALAVLIYNLCAPVFGGVTLHLKPQHPPRKRKDAGDS